MALGVRFVVLVAFVAACVDASPTSLEATSRVTVWESDGYGPPQLDVLVVIDDTSAAAPYSNRLATLPSVIENTYVSINGGTVDMHIGVTTDGTLRHVTPSGASYASIRTDFDLLRMTNFTGTLGEAMTSLTNVGTENPAPFQPLAAVRRVLEENPDAFLRPNAYLGIVIISASDDASPDRVTDYAAWLKSVKPDPNNIVVIGITASPSARLDELFAQFPYRAYVGSITDGDYLAPFMNLRLLIRTIIPGLCMHVSDVDLDTPGAQYDCTVTTWIRGSPQVLPPCKLAGDQLCWSLIDSSQECGPEIGFTPVKPYMPPYRFFTFVPPFRMECVVTDGG